MTSRYVGVEHLRGPGWNPNWVIHVMKQDQSNTDIAQDIGQSSVGGAVGLCFGMADMFGVFYSSGDLSQSYWTFNPKK